MKIDTIITNGLVVTENFEGVLDIAINHGKIIALGYLSNSFSAAERIDAKGLVVFPGLVDPHVHFREPGPNEEEDFLTGSRAAAAGGVTTVLEQPVDTPPTTTLERFNEKIQLGKERSYVDFGLWAGVVPGNLEDLQDLKDAGAWAFKAFICGSDPLYPMVDDGVLLSAMNEISRLDQMIAIHAENDAIINAYNERLNAAESVKPIEHVRSRPLIAELEAIQRCVLFAGETGARLHILHLSAGPGAELIAEARKKGVRVTVESCPHYLVLDETALEKYGPYAKCNPPLRDMHNQEILWQAILEGKIDCLVSDHSPYTTEDKVKGLEDIRKAAPGINGLELGLPLMIDHGVNTGRLSLSRLAQLMAVNPAKLFGLYPEKGSIQVGGDADLLLIDLNKKWVVDASRLETKNKWSPFDGWEITGKVLKTMVRGKTVYENGEYPQGPGFGNFLSTKSINQ